MSKKKIITIAIISIITTIIIAITLLALWSNNQKKQITSYQPPIGTSSEPIKTSPTTGLPSELTYQPVMVVIENSPDARPQQGLQIADVVYEVPVEGDITRFVSVYQDNVPTEVMPVRSGREPFLYIQGEWDAIFMHYGGSGSGYEDADDYTFYGNSLYNQIKIDLDGISNNPGGIYQRVSTIPAPHNVRANPQAAQKLYDYQPIPLGWKFDPTIYYPGSSTVTTINLPYTGINEDFVTYQYDINEGVYLRSMNGETFLDAETKTQIKIKNLIVQHTNYSIKGGTYKDWEMIGNGTADFYIGGMHVTGSWSKESATTPTIYKDAQGNQIVLKPGNTWIHIHP